MTDIKMANRSGPARLAARLGRINRIIAILAGIALLATVALILLEIVLRQTAIGSIGGSDEISGYVMAGVATWGFAYALTERAHVRIDILQSRLPLPGKGLFDLLALASVFAIALTVSIHAWDVLGKTLARDSHANTPLATPLWIPQSIWFGGWVWLAIVAVLLLACITVLIAEREWESVRAIAGGGTETGEL
ncbi:TRAP transporter small permease [Jiella sp. MQZ9-1]|uniref:TRAP transporter small permease protein n=1 Tax=Jiella flava TaxID=2816857 RepID=A0A939JS44_9HYPH|nr:TRAP transporter small permease [Jiella flava]MBO0662583.1 TRAP transporter small permease [Jiella flava]MCD2472954.1 TRAP transporter small permease [Jiella flava]